MRAIRRWTVLVAVLPLLAGCGPRLPDPVVSTGGNSDLDQVCSADVRLLFVGNSHTSSHELPKLIGQMIMFLAPEKKVYAHLIPVAFLDDAAKDPTCAEEIDTRPWTHVVLQAQRISMSGRFEYSRKEGIDIATRARGRGAAVIFYPEWGLKDVPGDGPRQEKVYREMAGAAGVGLARVGRAWDLALAERPDLPLHGLDGNHQSTLGAFLTAAVLTGRLTGESLGPLAAFPHPLVKKEDRAFLAGVAEKALAESEGQ